MKIISNYIERQQNWTDGIKSTLTHKREKQPGILKLSDSTGTNVMQKQKSNCQETYSICIWEWV